MNRSEQQKKKMGEKRRGIGFETVAAWHGGESYIVETLSARLFKKSLNASKPSEHPPQVEECLKV